MAAAWAPTSDNANTPIVIFPEVLGAQREALPDISNGDRRA